MDLVGDKQRILRRLHYYLYLLVLSLITLAHLYSSPLLNSLLQH